MYAWYDNQLIASRYVSQYVLEGHKYYDQDTTLFLYKVLQVPHRDDRHSTEQPGHLPAFSDLKPFDNGESFVLQASIEAIDGNHPEVKEKAINQLLAIKETLKQAVDLVIGDRLALDTRVPLRLRKP